MLTVFCVPYIWYPGCEENGDTIELAMQRAIAAQKLVNGTLDPDEFLDMLDAQGFDVYSYLNGWQSELEQLPEEPCYL